MLDRLTRRSWGLPLLHRSLQVMRASPRLMRFPMLMGVGLAAVFLLLLLPLALWPTGHLAGSEAHWQAVVGRFREVFSWRHEDLRQGWVYAYLAAVYFVTMAWATFCNVAFYHEIMKALSDEEVSVRRGVEAALRRLRAILVWSAFAASIGLLLRVVGDRSGRLSAYWTGTAWNVASIFVIPVMLREDTADPVTLLRRSAGTLRQTWTDAVIGRAGLIGAWLILALGWLLVVGLLMMAVATLGVGDTGGIMILGVLLLALLGFGALSFLCGLAGSIHRCALYIYATEGVVPGPYSPMDMGAPWKIHS